MALSLEQINRIAHLARIEITEAEAHEVSHKLVGIFGLIDEMQSVDTTGVPPTAYAQDLVLRLREDRVTEHNQREHFQQNSPATEGGYFLVPKVIE
jgi:aspartyl-tRNA(Asn)/glutamyl-tRNA(Gln) amidotransferase subunit C